MYCPRNVAIDTINTNLWKLKLIILKIMWERELEINVIGIFLLEFNFNRSTLTYVARLIAVCNLIINRTEN